MARPGKDFFCSMQYWAGYGKTVSLDTLCRALGVASPKGDMDGSKILDAWLAGEYERIADYNLKDAIAVRDVYHRLVGLPRAAA
jgi:predicted PolB exonuclease-like 3'-5' exonuclease